MKTLKPIIQTEEPDKYGRTVKVGITDGTTASFFQVMSMGEVRNLRDELTKFLNHSGAGTPVFDFKSFEEMRDRVWKRGRSESFTSNKLLKSYESE